MSKKYIAIIMGILLVFTTFFGCDTMISSKPDDNTSEPQTVVEYPLFIGDVQIQAQPQAVISLSPATTEMLFEMGYGSRVMGISEYCDYPPEALDKLRCGSALGLDKKSISLRPVDLVVTTTPLLDNDLIWFQQQNIPVLVLSHGDDWDMVRTNYINMGIAMSGMVAGEEYGRAYYDLLEEDLAYASNLAQTYLADNEPLTSILLREMSYTMATGDTFEQLLLDELQLTNEGFPYTNWLYPSAEVIALEPNVIFCDISIPIDTVKTSLVYTPVQAVLHDKVMNIDFTILDRQTPRMFDLIRQMADFAYEDNGV